MLVAEHELLVTQVKKLADPQYRSDDNKEDRLLNLSYGEPPRTSSGLSFHGGASPIPIPIPAPASSIPGHSSGLPSSSESSLDKENSAPGTQQSIVTELVAIVEEEHLDIGGESGHVMARQVQDELVRSVLGQRCRSKAHPSRRDHRFHPFPHLGDGGDGFPFSRRGHRNRTSEEEIVNGSKGPDVPERVQMVTEISRLTQHRWFSVEKPCSR